MEVNLSGPLPDRVSDTDEQQQADRKNETLDQYRHRTQREQEIKEEIERRLARLKLAQAAHHAPLAPKSKWSRIIWYLSLISCNALLVSTVVSIVYLVQDIRRFGPRAGHIIWLTLSAAGAVILTGISYILFLRGRETRRHRREAATLELTAGIQDIERQSLADLREREQERQRLAEIARRSLHSVEESERDVRVLSETLSEHGIRNILPEDPSEVSSENIATHWDADEIAMTDTERRERLRVKQELVARRRAGSVRSQVSKTLPTGLETEDASFSATKKALESRQERRNQAVLGWRASAELAQPASTGEFGDNQDATEGNLGDAIHDEAEGVQEQGQHVSDPGQKSSRRKWWPFHRAPKESPK